MCGEAAASARVLDPALGPSPRVRGSPGVAAGELEILGSIPACAGKPVLRAVGLVVVRVHPRVCGEAAASARVLDPALGPSPRVRGSRARCEPPPIRLRSIPACAGKPCPTRGRRPWGRVHPRVCGEASVRLLTACVVSIQLSRSSRRSLGKVTAS